jgi:hypothetical protein
MESTEWVNSIRRLASKSSFVALATVIDTVLTPLSYSIFENCPPRCFRGVTTTVIPYFMKSRGF